MWNLIHFFAKNSPFFTWLVLAILSIVLLCQTNPYHRSIWFGSANAVAGGVYDLQSNVTGYFNLRAINEDLLVRTGQLESENLRLQQQLQYYQDQIATASDTIRQYDYTIAHVVGNTITQAENYITLDKGSRQGLRQDYGVADQNGVIGIISKVSENYSLVISVLNPKLRLSVMIKNTESMGSLVWDGVDPRYALLEDLPRNVKFETGDTIVTTGFTTSFPKNVPVGRVSKSFDNGGNFLTLKVELFSDFDRLNDVHVIINHKQEEQLEIEKIDPSGK